MKKMIGYLLVGLGSFAAGGAFGYILRKKTGEVAFEVVTPEEQMEAMAQDGVLGEDAIHRPVDIQEAIDRTFGKQSKADIPETNEDGNNIVQMDTQKEQYFKQWKAEEAADHYAGSSQQDDESENEDDSEETDIPQRSVGPLRMKGGPDIEEATMDDWDHWLGIIDGEYDPVEVWWFDEDNVLTDEKGNPLENPERHLGFDVASKFEEIDESTTGDPDIRVVYNHKQGAIFQLVRKHMSYDRKTAMEEYGDDGEDDERDWIRSRHE